jgi:hypothetical protein
MLVVDLLPVAEDRAEARLADHRLAAFEPAALLVDQPLFSQRPMPADPIAYGQRLFAALGGAAWRAALANLPRAPHLDSMIAVCSSAPELMTIPWEYLHDGEDFLIFKHLFVREVANAPLPAAPDPARPWRLVVMGSDPLLQAVRDPQTNHLTGYAPLERLEVVRELERMRDTILSADPPPPIRWQRIAPTRQALIDDLATSEPILFHYTGHGDVEDGQALLCFDDGSGCMDPRPVADLAAELRDLVYFAFLNACRTADSREPGANLALGLVQNGIPAVLGTQYQVLDAAAHFAHTFYRFLAVGQHPAQALYRARLQLKNQLRNRTPRVGRAGALPGAGLRLAGAAPQPGCAAAADHAAPAADIPTTRAGLRSAALRWAPSRAGRSGPPVRAGPAADRDHSRCGRDGQDRSGRGPGPAAALPLR